LISRECVDEWPQVQIKEQIKFHNKYEMAMIQKIIDSFYQLKSGSLLPVSTTSKMVSQDFGAARQ